MPPAPPSFVLNLGKDSDNLCLHFNPRFEAHGDVNTIVCNSKVGGAWGEEHRESTFPFLPGSVMEVGWGLGPGAGVEPALAARDLSPTLPAFPFTRALPPLPCCVQASVHQPPCQPQQPGP